MPDAATLTALVQLFGPIGALAVMVGYGVWQKSPSKPPENKTIQTPISKEYEKTMADMMGRVAGALEKQSSILERIERHIDVMVQTAKK